MKLYIASDHAGTLLQEKIINNLTDFEFITSNVPTTPTDDYPLFAFDICNRMNHDEDYAILICKTGIGISIAANKVKGIRCAKISSLNDVITSKKHNHINAIAFNADTNINDAINYIKALITTPYDKDARHQRRVNEIIKYEQGEYNEL